MTTDPLYLGLDLATADARLTVVAADGQVHEVLATPLPAPSRPAPGHSEQDPHYAAAATELLGRLSGVLGADIARVAAICVTSTSGTVVPCDGAGRPVGPALLYDDARATGQVARLRAAGHEVGVTHPMARMGWRAANGGAEVYLSAADVVVAALTGAVRATDTSHTLKAGIDPVARSWDLDLAALIGVPASTLPDLVAPTTVLGEVTGAVTADLGLPVGVVVVAGMTDGCTAQLASGAVRPGDTLGVLGTTLVVKGVATTAVDTGPVYSHLAPDGRWWPGGASNVGAALVRSEFPDHDLDALAVAAADHGPSPAVRYPLPRPGERFPVADPAFAGFLLGTPVGPAAAYRTLLEGVAFTERLGLELLAGLGVSGGTHRITGGATASRVWNTIRATVLARPVLRPEGATSGLGAAILARCGQAGLPLGDAVGAMTGPAERCDPDPTEVDRLADGYGRFTAELRHRGLLPPDRVDADTDAQDTDAQRRSA